MAEEKKKAQGKAAPEETVAVEAEEKAKKTEAAVTTEAEETKVEGEPEKPPEEQQEETKVEGEPERPTEEQQEETKVEEEPEKPTEEVAEEIKGEEEPEAPVKEEEKVPVVTPADLKKPLEKMTAKELREVASGIPELTGVHAMKKEDLLAAIRNAWGIKVEKPPKREKEGKAAAGVAELKAKIHQIKAKRAEAIQKRDKRMARIYRRMINRLKKRSRRAA